MRMLGPRTLVTNVSFAAHYHRAVVFATSRLSRLACRRVSRLVCRVIMSFLQVRTKRFYCALQFKKRRGWGVPCVVVG